MRHRKKHKILGRSKSHRKSLLKNLAKSFFTHKKIQTTRAKAFYLKPYVEKLITKGKINNLQARRELIKKTGSALVAKRILEEVSPKYKERKGGYTRIIRLGRRKGDRAEVVQLELV